MTEARAHYMNDVVDRDVPVATDILFYNARTLSPDLLANPMHLDLTVKQDLANIGLSVADLSCHRVLISFLSEGHCSKIAEPLIEYFRALQVQDLAVIYNTVEDIDSLSYRALSFSAHMLDPFGWIQQFGHLPADLAVDRKFLCLMRRQSPSRARLASELLRRNLDVTLSFGVGVKDISHQLDPYRDFFPPGTTLPILVDGYWHGTPGFDRDLFFRCAVNIIAESSAQDESNTWSGIFITEKTSKCFFFRQFPVWWAVPGLVSEVRRLGFDVFDDIIDHSYDGITDPDLRLQSLLQEIMKLDSINLTELRKQHADRLEANWQHVQHLHHNDWSDSNWPAVLKTLGWSK